MTERDSCGVGFVVSAEGEPEHGHLQRALRALACVEHRGGCLADGKTGDGAGVMAEIPFELLGVEPGEVAVGTLFIGLPSSRQKGAFEIFERTFANHSLVIEGYRDVPVDTSVLGRQARDALPAIVQIFIRRPNFCRTPASFASLLYSAKQAVRTQLGRAGVHKQFFFTSLSTKTVVYKALTTGEDLAAFYPDLQDPRFRTRFALFHRRFSTNTVTSWDKAQPFRMIAHNGEINTIECNRAWAHAREQTIGLPRDELLTHEGISDSGNLNEMVEALRWRSSIPHLSEILAIMVPPAKAGSNAFYKFWSRAVEPWDGPAFLAFSDGDIVGARLDRNGFRPCRWARTPEAFYLASEAGVFELDEAHVLEKGALTGGQGVHVDVASGEIHFRDPSESRENLHASFDPRLEGIGREPMPDDGFEPLANLALFRYGQEDIQDVLLPMISSGKEPIGSMGDTARPAILSSEPRPFFDFFYQSFAQVTNPPLDHLRERFVTELSSYLGRRPNVFAPKTLIPMPPAIELESPVLEPEELQYLKLAGLRSPNELSFESIEIQSTFARVRGPKGLEEALDSISERVLAAIRGGCTLVVLSDRHAKYERPPIPSLLALRAATSVLTSWGHRLDASIIVDSGDVRSTHDLACLVGFGAAAVCPYMAFELADRHSHPSIDSLPAPTRRRHLKQAFEAGVLKVMSKMGISTLQGYQGAKLFSTLGLSSELLERYFEGIESPIGGLGLEDVAERILAETEHAERVSSVAKLSDYYQLREHRKGIEGEHHSMTSALSRAVHDFIGDHSLSFDRWDAYQAYLHECEAGHPVNLRHLLALASDRSPLPLSDVQPRSEILRRFGSGAMSFGAINAESQRDLIAAMKEVGGRSGSGEGGENPYYYVDGTSASVKQVASGRFGVTAEYLVSGEEIEIKVAQGAKPGEGGQLMGVKVDAQIARARHSTPGVDLISPPPLHDIYSIEDLRELIYELKQLKPGVRVCVKLVSGAHIGTIAAGVVKAGADVIQISGGDGGTGAATLSSMKHAGLPWELGLVEVHETLLGQGLRQHVVLRVDGGLQSGRDIVTAALLGAEEFGFGKLLLIAEGCIMARVCQKNTCPRGIATHDPKFKKKYRGTKEDVVTLLHYLAEDVRRHLAALGVERMDQLLGRSDWLSVAAKHEDICARLGLDLSRWTTGRPHDRGFLGSVLSEPTSRLNQRIVEDARPAIERGEAVRHRYPILSTERSVGSTLAGVIASRVQRSRRPGQPPLELPEGLVGLRFDGSAGQGFGAFLVSGLDVELVGEANDSFGKSMSGGRLVLRPPEGSRFSPETNSIVGNCALYGATGGRAFINGLAGDRFCVRNSGADAVVEGVGLHACEYMTNGTVVILGAASHNIGAGMTGGELFVPRALVVHLNEEYLVRAPIGPAEVQRLRGLLDEHVRRTASRPAARALGGETPLEELFVRCLPRTLVRKMPVGIEAELRPSATAG